MTQQFLFKTLLVAFGSAGSVFFAFSATAQNTSELGIGLGGMNYKGDLSPEHRLLNNRPAFSAFYRKDISAPVTLRGTVAYGLLRGNDADQKDENGNSLPLPTLRQASTKGSLLDVAGTLEYNFFDYHNRRDKVHFTPYVYVGVAGFLAFTSTTGAQAGFNQSGTVPGIAVPAGVGLKLALSRHWNLGLETGARKAITDMIDHVKEQSPAFADRFSQDWYYYTGISVSYTFYKIRCPESSPAKEKPVR